MSVDSSCVENLCVTHLPPGQNGSHFADDIFICIFANEKYFDSNFAEYGS